MEIDKEFLAFFEFLVDIKKSDASVRGRQSLQDSGSYGVKKIKQLAIELAIQGKFAPSLDPGDAIDNEVEELSGSDRSGALKIVATSAPYSTPKSWKWILLGDSGKIFSGDSINEDEKSKKYTNISSGYPYIATKDVGYGSTTLDYQNGVSIPIGTKGFKVAKKNAVLICAEGGSAGKKIGITNQDICFGNKLYANETYSFLLPKFIFYLYQSNYFYERFTNNVTGIIGGISLKEFNKIPIPIPPLKEQERIISALDDFMNLCQSLEKKFDIAEQSSGKLTTSILESLTNSKKLEKEVWNLISEKFTQLFTLDSNIDLLKKSILSLAINGSLTRFERAKFEIENKFQSSDELLDSDTPEPFAIPSSWSWVVLDNILEAGRGISYGVIKLGAEPKTGGVPVLRCSDVKSGYIDKSKVRRVTDEIEAEYLRTRLKGGEILLNIRGTLGGVALVDKSFSGYNVAREVAVIPVRQDLCGDYLVNVMLSPYFWSEVVGGLRGIAYKGLNLGTLREFKIPLPPIWEQELIVKKVAELFLLCDELKNKLDLSSGLKKSALDIWANRSYFQVES